MNKDKIVPYLAIEGIDGSGKTTQIKKLLQYLNQQGCKTKSIHFTSKDNIYGKIIKALYFQNNQPGICTWLQKSASLEQQPTD